MRPGFSPLYKASRSIVPTLAKNARMGTPFSDVSANSKAWAPPHDSRLLAGHAQVMSNQQLLLYLLQSGGRGGRNGAKGIDGYHLLAERIAIEGR